MDDDEVEGGREELQPVPLSVTVFGMGIATCLGAAGIAEAIADMFVSYARELGHVANHHFYKWKAKDEGEKFAADVMHTIGGLDSLG